MQCVAFMWMSRFCVCDVECMKSLVCALHLQVMQLAGLEGQQVTLLLEDYQFVHPAFLEMVNSLLSSGVSCACAFV